MAHNIPYNMLSIRTRVPDTNPTNVAPVQNPDEDTELDEPLADDDETDEENRSGHPSEETDSEEEQERQQEAPQEVPQEDDNLSEAEDFENVFEEESETNNYIYSSDADYSEGEESDHKNRLDKQFEHLTVSQGQGILVGDQNYGSDVSELSEDVEPRDAEMEDDKMEDADMGDGISSPITLTMAEHQKSELLSYAHDLRYEKARCQLTAAEEELSSLNQKVVVLKRKCQKLEERKQKAQDTVTSSFEMCGISAELRAEYEAFCEFLHPKYGLRGGFTAVAFEDHKGDYIQYDPDFEILKECVQDETPYHSCNYRVEASHPIVLGDDTVMPAYDLAFWPLKPPENKEVEIETWGDQFPELYRLAFTAVREKGSGTAMEMLVRLPHRDAGLTGWLFNYQPEPAFAMHPDKSMRWRFRSSHKIDCPISDHENLLHLQSMMEQGLA